MGFASPGEVESALAVPSSQPAPTLPFAEGVSAVASDIWDTSRTESLAFQQQKAITDSLNRYSYLAGLPAPELPYKTWNNWEVRAFGGQLDALTDSIKSLRTPQDGSTGPADPMLRTYGEIQQDVKDRVARGRIEANRAGLGAQLVGGLSLMADPLNLLALPAGVAEGTGFLARMGIEAATIGTTQAGVELTSLSAKEAAGVPQTLGGAAANIALTAAGGAALTGLFHGAGLVARRLGMLEDYHAKVKSGDIVPTRESEAAAASLQDMVDTVPPGPSPAFEKAHLEATAAATDVLRAETPQAAEVAAARYAEKVAAVEKAAPTVAESIMRSPAAPKPETATDFLARERAALDAEVAPRVPQAKRRETVLAEVKKRGGLDPNQFTTKSRPGRDYNWKEDIHQAKLLKAIDGRTGIGLDDMAATLEQEGIIPPGTTGDQLLGLLKDGALSSEGAQRAGEAAMEHDLGQSYAIQGFKQFETAANELRTKYGVEPYAHEVWQYMAEGTTGTDRAAIDAAIAAEQASPLPPVADVTPETPLERPKASPYQQIKAAEQAKAVEGAAPVEGAPAAPKRFSTGDPEADAALHKMLTEAPDTHVSIEIDGVEHTGRLADVVDRLNAELEDLGATADCLLGGA